MAENDTSILDGKNAIPNKLLQSNGTITDLTGNSVSNMVDSYKAKPAIPNKFLNADGTYSTLEELIGGMVDTEIFIVVEELPESGNEQKIYLVPDGEGGFIEYHWTGSAWDPIGNISAEVEESHKVFYWNGAMDETGLQLWNQIVQTNTEVPVIVYMSMPKSAYTFAGQIYFTTGALVKTSGSYSFAFTPYQLEDTGYYNSYSRRIEWRHVVSLTFSQGIVTRAVYGTYNDTISYLSTTETYSNPYTPQYPGSPATKKYVDDAIANSITTVLGGEY